MCQKSSFYSDYRALRAGRPVFFESPTHHAAHVAIASREGRTSIRIQRMMALPIPHDRLLADYWVHLRCGAYAVNAMRRAAI